MSAFKFLTDAYDFVSAKADEVQDLIIQRRFNRLQESTFEVVILSHIEGTSAIDSHIDSDTSRKWFRIRALDGSDDGLPSPFTAPKKIRISTLKMRINGHRQAYWSEDEWSENSKGKPPEAMQVWLARYSKKNYRGPIILQRLLRPQYDKALLTITDAEADKMKNFQGADLLGDKIPPTVPDDGLSMLPDDLPLENYKKLAKGLTNMISFLGENLSTPGLYDDYRCGATGQKGCAQSVIDDFNAKPITSRTFKEIAESQSKWTVPAVDMPSVGVGAVGIFSIKPSVFEELKSKFNIPDTAVFDKETQDGLGAYIILKRNNILGGYMLGGHTDAPTAAHELAVQWSVFPSQYTGNIDGAYRSRNKSYYDGIGYKAKINAKQAVKYLESWQKSFQQFLGKPDQAGNNRSLLKTS